ncbi:hypothetical protein Hte_005771 [Hypoxylon texense]
MATSHSDENFVAHLTKIVKEAAETWESYANVKFTFVYEQEGSDIRVSLKIIPRSRVVAGASLIGRDSGLCPKDEPTMFLDIGRDAADTAIRSTALHELGHSLGMIHEHMSPACLIEWHEEAVLAICGGDKRRAHIDYFQAKESETRHSNFDPESIMIYNIPPSLMKNHVETNPGNDLSEMDKEWAGKFYPRTPSASQQESTIDRLARLQIVNHKGGSAIGALKK